MVDSRSISPSGIYMSQRYRVEIIPVGDYDALDETWPDRLSVIPRVGDYIESTSGRKLQVLSLVHTADQRGLPYIIVEIGKQKSSDVTPTEGGAVAENII